MELEDGNEDLFARKRLCIKTKHANNILDSFKIIVKGKVFLIRAKELFVWSPSFKEVLEVVHCSDDESVKNEADINVVDNTVNNEGEESDSEQSSKFSGEECIRSHHNSDRCSSRVFEEVEKSDINIQSDGRVIRDIRKEGGSILDIFDEMIKVGQTMGFTMDGCTKDMEKIIGSNGGCPNNLKTKVIFLQIGDSWSIVSEAAASLGCSVMKTPFNYLGIIVGGAADNSSSIGFLGSTPIYNMFMKLRSRRQFLTKSGKPSKEFFSMVFKKMIVKITWVLLAKSFLPRILQHGILINQKSFNLPQCQGVDVFSKLARLGLLNGLHNSFGRSYGTVIALLTVALCSWSEAYTGELIQGRRLPVTALHCEDGMARNDGIWSDGDGRQCCRSVISSLQRRCMIFKGAMGDGYRDSCYSLVYDYGSSEVIMDFP
ncbi:hypothetical protein Tco_0897738 [Tanacetum coccineum]